MKIKERGSLNILKSRYVVITMAAVMCLAVLMAAAAKLMLFKSSGTWHTPDEEKVQQLLGRGAEIVFPFGKYSDIVILDGEKGIFGVREPGDNHDESGEYKTVDAEGNPADYHGKEDAKDYRITEDRTAIVDSHTGKELFHTSPGEYIADSFGDLWIIDGTGSEEFKAVHDKIIFSYYYAMDSEFNIALDGMIFSDFKPDRSYMLIQKEKGVDCNTREKLYGRSLFGGYTEKVVINLEGKVVYHDDDYDDEDGYIRGIAGNIMIKGNDEYLTYIDLDKLATGENDHVIRRDKKIMCRMDFEDGTAAACILATKNESDNRMLEDFDPKNSDAEKQMKKYKWGFVDEDFEPITSMDFDGAYASENGYAVVIYDGSKALIRLKGGRES